MRSLASWAIITLVAVSTWKLIAQVRTVSPVTEIMKQKLDHAQSVLEGLALENFDLIKAHAGKLSALASAPGGWRSIPRNTRNRAFFSNATSDRLSEPPRTKTWTPPPWLTQR